MLSVVVFAGVGGFDRTRKPLNDQQAIARCGGCSEKFASIMPKGLLPQSRVGPLERLPRNGQRPRKCVCRKVLDCFRSDSVIEQSLSGGGLTDERKLA